MAEYPLLNPPESSTTTTSQRDRSYSLPRRMEMSAGKEIRVATLNMWCLPQPWPVGSKDRRHRLEKLAETLLAEPYDIVGLQEIWGESDYLHLAAALELKYPYTHYFHSGFTGSGVCVFSRHRIVSTLTSRYSLNGFAHHIHRGDWFGGKVIGLVELEIDELRVNFYSTHLHAEYNRENDLYLPHRTAQAFELSQFVRHTSRGADFIIVCGDFNLEPEDLGMRLILANTKLLDAWRISHMAGSDGGGGCHSLESCRGMGRGATCDRTDNCYTSRALRNKDESKRIDYILYKNGRMNVTLEECEISFNKIAGEEMNYSDHVGLHARFKVQPDQHRQISVAWEPCRPLLIEAVGVITGGQRRARTDRTIFLVTCCLLVLLTGLSVLLDEPYPYLSWPLSLLRALLTAVALFCLYYGLIGLTLERKALKASKQAIRQELNQ